ncbi:hypothetical protein [Amycolatopsis sp. NPDC051128]|uniref:hypothetical protein n=1 Tax=Amycolatopsis sp. NPDC051128 TaxID=3155412 RepID=UPI0034244495
MTRLASDHAHRVVGLYGDPTVSWSILLEAALGTAAPEPEKLRARLAAAIQQHPHLGVVPEIERTSAADLPSLRERFASAPYERADPLVRVAVCAGEPALLVAAHHGALDGLGLLALLGVLLDVPVSSGATGIGAREGGKPFLVSAVQRLAEALFAPPGRIVPDRAAPAAGDVFAARHEPRLRLGAAGFVAAAARATERWNRAHGARAARVVAALGASRRSGAAPEPVHDSAFFRLRLGSGRKDVAAVLAAQPPEPDFPARSSRLARLGTRLLASRLGSTFLVSNLGVVSTGDTVRSLAFYPAASGRSGVAFGAATTGGTTTVTVRARRKDFDAAAVARLLGEFRDAVREQAGPP